MPWHTQAGSITTNLKIKINFTFSELISIRIVKWDFHVDDVNKGIYDIILGIYLLTDLGLNKKFSDHVIEG